MKFSRLRNWIANNTISISTSTHVHKTFHNFISTPLVQEGWDEWTETHRCLQTACDFQIFLSPETCSVTTVLNHNTAQLRYLL
jgi:hypothetical protein